MARRSDNAEGGVIIKKYANRRLYNTASSSYITLDDLSKMTREGTDFKVLDAKTGEDITHSILTQIIMEEESNGEQMLPISFLRQLIAMYGNSMQSMMPGYLDAMMANFKENQARFQDAFRSQGGGNPFARIAETNMAMMRAAAEAMMVPGAGKSRPAPTAPASAASGDNAQADELAELRAQMAAMQKKLDGLSR